MVGVSRPRISAAIKTGALEALKRDGLVLIPREALQAWLDGAVPYAKNTNGPDEGAARTKGKTT